MNKLIIDNGEVDLPTFSIAEKKYSILDGRSKRLKEIAKKYPPIESFEEINDNIFQLRFKNMEIFYFVVHIYSRQRNFKVRVHYNVNELAFYCKEVGCSFTVKYKLTGCSYRLSHNHEVRKYESLKMIETMTSEIKNDVNILVNNSALKVPNIIKIIEMKYIISKEVKHQIKNQIITEKKNLKDIIDGKYKFFKMIINNYKYYKSKSVMLVIMDEIHLKKYTTLLADGTFNCLLGKEQLYLVYCAVSPKLILLVAYAIMTTRNKEDYLFIYGHLQKYCNIINVVHDKEKAVVSVLRSLGINFVFDTYHLFLYLKETELKRIIYKYIKAPSLSEKQKIVDEADDKYKVYFTKEGIKQYGIYGIHSTGNVEFNNYKIKKELYNKRVRFDGLLEVLQNLYKEEIDEINNQIQEKECLYYSSILWKECSSNLYNQLQLLSENYYTAYKEDENSYVVNNEFYISRNESTLICSCGYQEVSGVPCDHILYARIRCNINVCISEMISNECFKDYFNSQTNITNYNGRLEYPEDINEIIDKESQNYNSTINEGNNENDISRYCESNSLIISESEINMTCQSIKQCFNVNMINEIDQYCITGIYDELTSLMYDRINKHDFCLFINNNYNNISFDGQLIIITLIYLLNKKIDNFDNVLLFIDNNFNK